MTITFWGVVQGIGIAVYVIACIEIALALIQGRKWRG